MNKYYLSGLIVLCLAVTLLGGCRGYRTDKQPFHLNPNMDWQRKYKAQTLSELPPQHTVPNDGQGRVLDRNPSMPPVTKSCY